MIYDVACDSGPAVSMNPESTHMAEVQSQLCEVTPLDDLQDKRKWRDERLALLAKLRKDMDAK